MEPTDVRAPRSLWRWLALAAVVGIGVFGALARRNVTIEQATPTTALRRFEEIRTQFSGADPVFRIDATHAVTRRSPPAVPATPPSRLIVLGYRASAQRLVRASVPFWFLKMKGWGAVYALHDTGLDPERLGATPDELERYDVCVWLDEVRANGDRVLAWTE